jgi:hypothetical protein
VWQSENKFGKKCANLSLKFEVFIVCKIEQQNFLCDIDFLLGEIILVKSIQGAYCDHIF